MSPPSTFPAGEAATASPPRRGGGWWFVAVAAGVLGLYLAHVWTQVDPRLIHVRQHPVYLTGWQFFADFLERPGGPVAYASALATEVFAVGWAGALVLTAVAAGIVLAARRLLARFGRRSTWPALAPVLLLAVLTNQYEHPMATGLGLLVALVATVAYLEAGPWRWWARAGLFVLLAAGVYALAGGPMLLFAVLAALAEGLAPGRPRPVGPQRWLAAVCLAAGAVVPLAARRWVFFVPDLADAYTVHLPFAHVHDVAAVAAAVGLYGLFPAASVVAALWPDRSGGGRARVPRRVGVRVLARLVRSRLVRAGFGLALIGLGVVVALATLDARERRLLALDDHVLHGRWEAALGVASRLRVGSPHLGPRVFLALYHRGRLLEACFAYPLGPAHGTPPGIKAFYMEVEPDRGSQVQLALACVNEAEHLAHEALETMGEYPPVLKRLAIINVLKGHPEAAKRFLGVLDRTPWHGGWSAEFRRAMEADAALAGHPAVRRIRSLMPTTDRVAGADTRAALHHTLAEHPENRMAFEYLMLDALLNHRPDRVVENLPRFRRLAYDRLPRHLQEAILHHLQRTRQRRINLYGHTIDRTTVQRYQVFLKRLARHKDDAQAAWDALAEDFGATFWFFDTFGCTAAGRRGPPIAKREGDQP